MFSRFKCWSAIGLLSAVLFAGPSVATPIQFVFEGSVTGTLDGQAFDSHIRFDFTSTTQFAIPWQNQYANGYEIFLFDSFPGLVKRVTIDGIGSTNITTNLFLVSNPNPGCECVGILRTQDVNTGDIFLLRNTVFNLQNPYDFKTSIGPVGGMALQTWGSLKPIETELGTLVLADNYSFGTDATFQAILLPVPAAGWLFGSALGLLAWARRKRS